MSQSAHRILTVVKSLMQLHLGVLLLSSGWGTKAIVGFCPPGIFSPVLIYTTSKSVRDNVEYSQVGFLASKEMTQQHGHQVGAHNFCHWKETFGAMCQLL